MELGIDIRTALGSLARSLLVSAGGFLSAKGIIAVDGSQTEAFVGIGMAILGFLWSLWQKRQATLITAVAAKAGPIVTADTPTVQAAQAAEALAQRKVK